MNSKFLLVAVFSLISIGCFSQKSDFFLLGKFGYHYGDPGDRLGIGAEARVAITDPIKIVSSMTYMFTHQDVKGFDVNVNAIYSFPIQDTQLQLYPLVGINMDNNRWSKNGNSRSWTKWGANIGGGADYYVSRYNFVNIEIQYTLIRDYAKMMIGFGHRF